MHDGWQVRVEEDWGYSDVLRVYLFRRLHTGEGEFIVEEPPEEGRVIRRQRRVIVDMAALNWKDSIQPTVTLPRAAGIPVAKALLEAFAERIRTPSEARVEGELEATKLHLADMRTLVFKEAP